MTKKSVVLFKKKDKIDQYNDLFLKNGYVPQFIPVLDHQTQNIENIKLILFNGPHQENFNGLILTSQRSVQAMLEAYNLLLEQGQTISNQVFKEWNDLPIYMVGPQTAKVLSEFPLFNCSHNWKIFPRAAELIIPLINDKRGQGRLLFLAGDKRRDLIPTELTKAQIDFFELQSYATCVHPDLSINMKNFSLPNWIVYFSPSGLNFLLNTIDLETKQNILSACQKSKDLSYTKIASIGPTTYDSILLELGLKSDVMATEPDAQHLIDAIVKFDHQFCS